MSNSTAARKLTELNYRQWAVETEALLCGQGLWKYVTGEMRVTQPPFVPTSGAASPMPAAPRDPRDISHDFQPKSTDSAYLTRFDHLSEIESDGR